MADDDKGTKDDKGKGDTGPADTEGTPEDRAKLAEALRKEREGRKSDATKLRELEAKAARLDELEGASKSEQTKAAERIAQLERDLAERDLRAARLEACAAAGLPLADARRLSGTTAEELAQDALDWKAERDGKADDKGDQGQQQQRARTGDQQAGGGAPATSMTDLIRAKAGRQVIG